MKLNWFHFMPIDKSFFPKLLPPTTAFGSLYTLGINVIVYPKNRGYKNNYFIGIYDVYKNAEKPSINIIEKFWSEMLSCTFFPSLHSWENIFKMLFSFTYKKILVKYDFHTKGGGKTQNRHSSTAVEFSLQKKSPLPSDSSSGSNLHISFIRSPWFAKKNEFNEDECSFRIRTNLTPLFPLYFRILIFWNDR